VIEILIALAALVALAGLGFVGPLVPLEWVVSAGVVCVWYHVRLYAALQPRGALPARWWLRPVALHDQLEADERQVVLRWFYAGGAGFFLTAAGCALVILALVCAALGRD
jgi:hypothetical protein